VNATKKEPPSIHYFDQDFVDIYDKSWAWIKDFWQKGGAESEFQKPFFQYPQSQVVDQSEAAFASFFLVYSNGVYNPLTILDNFYNKQEENGAIRGRYDLETSVPLFTPENPEGVSPPLFAWAEYNLYHKLGLKRRVKEVVPTLEKHFLWLEETFKQPNGLYSVPLEATHMGNSPRGDVAYPVDFNAQQAMNALYISALGDILNDKDLSFRYKKAYYSLKTRINSQMWDEEEGFYYDLDKNGERLKVRTIAAFWTLLAEVPHVDRADRLITFLQNEKEFASPNPFPSLSMSHPSFHPKGNGYCGSVFPALTFMVIKGLEKYGKYELARESAIKHIYYILDTLHPDSKDAKEKGSLWEAYQPTQDGPAIWEGREDFNRPHDMAQAGLSSITLMIENVVGLYISLPRKTVDWIVPTLELMGIENLSLKRNFITILSNKSGRGWEIRLESEKLYYFTINILGKKKKTLPIPSGKCSMLLEKL
jgi:neutral trehalase